ncbi:MAG: alpha/beta fold hydrolase [Agrococcus casei]|uniref:alpha/beta fold hydrolase n=1 Tax=Agrococcus casei TaxID=343512 RepID=UPI003F9D0836
MTIPQDALRRLESDARLASHARGAAVVFTLAGDSRSVTAGIADGALTAAGDAVFSLTASDDVWERLLSATPAAGWQHVLPLVRDGRIRLAGDERAFWRHLHIVRGEYVRVEGPLGVSDVFVERAGEGPQLLCLPTAGSDTTQFHGLVTDTPITEHFEVIAFDLPWHGKSTPAAGVEYRLTPEEYTQHIVGVADALGLARPMLLGPSMAGAAVVRAIAVHPHRFAGAVSCQAAEDVRGRSSDLLSAADIDQSRLVPEWTVGLMNPASPAEHRDRVHWGYSSGASGVYAADIDGYQQWSFDDIASLLTAGSPHIAVLSGAYDTSVPPERSRQMADRIPNSSFALMPELGHFPHAEHPSAFWQHLEPALERLQLHDQLAGD